MAGEKTKVKEPATGKQEEVISPIKEKKGKFKSMEEEKKKKAADKKAKAEDGVEPEGEEVWDGKTTKDEIVKNQMPEEEDVSDGKMRTVLMRDNLRCSIGGQWYQFIKNRKYKVTPEVKEVLRKRNVLKPI